MEEHAQKQGTNISQMIVGGIVLIIIIGGLIALSAFSTPERTGENQQPGGEEYDLSGISYTENDSDAHVRGGTNPEVVVIEYSDFECPFCERFHGTMLQVLDEYGDAVQWEYRHFPLSSIHPEAIPAAVASECIAELGGNDAFWIFADTLFANQSQLGDALYLQAAMDAGVDSGAFETCLEVYDQSEVLADLEEVQSAGGRGTPFSVVIGPDGERHAFAGARPYADLASLIDTLLDS